MRLQVGTLGWLIAAILGIILFFAQTCQKPLEPPIVNQLPPDTILLKGDSIRVPVPGKTLYLPGKPIEVPANIDSNAIYSALVDSEKIIQWYLTQLDYNTIRPYREWILNDSNGRILQVDSLYQNKIKSRSYPVFEIYPHTYTVTKFAPPRTIFMLGGGIAGNQNSVGFSVGAGLLNKKKHLLILSYDLIRKEGQVQYYLPIRFRK